MPAALAAISGERASGGVHLGFDNAMIPDTNSGRSLVLPSGALAVNPTGDWSTLIEVMTGSAATIGSFRREMLFTMGAGTSVLAPVGGGFLYRDAFSRSLAMSRRSTSASTDLLGNNGTAVDFGFYLADHTAYLIVIGQKGNNFYARAVNIDTGVVQAYDGPDNKTTAPTFYKDSSGNQRAGANFTDLFTSIGGWGVATTSVNRQGWAGPIGAIAHCFASFVDVDLQAIASGSVSFGSLAGLQYWNRMVLPASGTSVPAETLTRSGAAIPVTGAITLTVQGTLLSSLFRPAGPFRTGGLIKLQREVAPYTFPLMVGNNGVVRPTGRAWFDGFNSAPAGYAIYGRLGTTPGTADFMASRQLTASHAGGAFRFPIDGIPRETTFYRSVWIGPSTSPAFGSDGHTFDERTPMKIAVRGLFLDQSHGSKQIDNTDSIAGAGGTGSAVAPSIPPGSWITARYANAQLSFAQTVLSTFPTTLTGPRELGVQGMIGDGATTHLSRIATLLSSSVDAIWAPRAGHSIDSFTWDRSSRTIAMTGSGLTRTASLRINNYRDGTSAFSMPGVDPGTVSAAWTGGSMNDVANAALTGAGLRTDVTATSSGLTLNVTAAGPRPLTIGDTLVAVNGADPAAAQGNFIITGFGTGTGGVGTYTTNKSNTLASATCSFVGGAYTVTGSGATFLIDYYSGAVTATFASDPGTVNMTWTTRYDTTDGNTLPEAMPDKFTIWGNTDTNGWVRKLMAVTPRHGYSYVYWGGATSNISDFQVNTDALRDFGRDEYEYRLRSMLDRVWALAEGTNPPLVLGWYGRGSGFYENNNMRQARWELTYGPGTNKAFVPGASTDATSGATATKYLWGSGFVGANSLQGNAGEHQDSQDIGGRLVGEQEGLAVASLMLGNSNLARGPEFKVARIKNGAPDTIEVIPTFFRPGTDALVVDTAHGADPATLYDWSVAIAPTAINIRGNAGTSTPEPISAKLNTATGNVELKRTAGAWPDPTTTFLRVRHKAYGVFMTAEAGGTANRATDEAAMTTALWDNGGGFTSRPGAETQPVFGLAVTVPTTLTVNTIAETLTLGTPTLQNFANLVATGLAVTATLGTATLTAIGALNAVGLSVTNSIAATGLTARPILSASMVQMVFSIGTVTLTSGSSGTVQSVTPENRVGRVASAGAFFKIVGP